LDTEVGRTWLTGGGGAVNIGCSEKEKGEKKRGTKATKKRVEQGGGKTRGGAIAFPNKLVFKDLWRQK